MNSRLRRNLILIVVLIIALAMFTGCIPELGARATDNPAGLFIGIWHGWIAPLSLILSFFNRDLTIYEPINTGWSYNFGFYIAIISGFGGLSLSRKRKKDD